MRGLGPLVELDLAGSGDERVGRLERIGDGDVQMCDDGIPEFGALPAARGGAVCLTSGAASRVRFIDRGGDIRNDVVLRRLGGLSFGVAAVWLGSVGRGVLIDTVHAAGFGLNARRRPRLGDLDVRPRQACVAQCEAVDVVRNL